MRYKDKMNDIEFFKSRVEELCEYNNRSLVETKEMFEEHLAGSRKPCEVVLELENDLSGCSTTESMIDEVKKVSYCCCRKDKDIILCDTQSMPVWQEINILSTFYSSNF